MNNNDLAFLKELTAPLKALEGVMSSMARNFASVIEVMKASSRELASVSKTIKSAFDGLARSITRGGHQGGSLGFETLLAALGFSAVKKVQGLSFLGMNVKPIAHRLFGIQQTYMQNQRWGNLNPPGASFPDWLDATYSKVLAGKNKGHYYNSPQQYGNWAQYMAAGSIMDTKLFGGLRKAVQGSGGIGQVLGAIKQGGFTAKDFIKFPLKEFSSVAFYLVRFLGALALLLPVIASVSLAFKTMSTASRAWVDKMRDTMVGLVTSGGSLGQVGQLRGMSAMLGLTPGQFGGRARAFGDLLTQGGIPAGIAAQMGIHPYGGLGGDQNYLTKFITAIKDVVSDPDFKRASTKARYLGLEDFMWLRDADKQHQNMVFSAQGQNMSASDRRAAANAQAEMFKLQKELNDAWTEFGRKVLPLVISGLRALTSVMLFFIDGLTTALGALVGGALGALVGFMVGGVPGAVIGGAAGIAVGAGAGFAYDMATRNNSDQVVDANTKAVQQNTDAIRANTMMQNGTYGGGNVFNGNAIPRGWNMVTINDSARGQAIALGALTL